MQYHLLAISRIETDRKDHLIAVTFYPAKDLCIQPRPYERILASCVHAFDGEGLRLASGLSSKGKRRLKLILRHPSFDEDERRGKGSAYFAMLFGRESGNDENYKGMADILYQTMCDLYRAEAQDEEEWPAACAKAVETFAEMADRFYR